MKETVIVIGYETSYLEYKIKSLGYNVFPINKHIWTSSYVMFSSGIAMVILAISIFIIDDRNYDFGLKFIIAFGSNEITAYVLHGILWKLFQFSFFGNIGFQELWMDYGIEFGLSPKLVSLGWAIFYTLIISVSYTHLRAHET